MGKRTAVLVIGLSALACDSNFETRAAMHVTAGGAPAADVAIVSLHGYRSAGAQFEGPVHTRADGTADVAYIAFNHIVRLDLALHKAGYPLRIVPESAAVDKGTRGCGVPATRLVEVDADLTAPTSDLEVPLVCDATTCEATVPTTQPCDRRFAFLRITPAVGGVATEGEVTRAFPAADAAADSSAGMHSDTSTKLTFRIPSSFGAPQLASVAPFGWASGERSDALYVVVQCGDRWVIGKRS